MKEIMTRDVVTVKAEQTVLEAANIYRERKVGCLVVVDKGICVGILTERDIIERVLCDELEPRRTKVKDVMSHPVKTISALDTIEKALQIMKDNHIKKLPVISNNTIVGIITVTDISHARSELTKRFIESWVKPRWMD